MSTASCPSCGRSTPVGRASCLYCGAELPPEIATARRPAAEAALRETAVPEDLDRLVSAALRGGTGEVRRLRQAMEQARGAAPPAPPRPEANPEGGPALVVAPPPAEEAAPRLDVAATLDAVAEAASTARRQWQAGRHEGARGTLEGLRDLLPALIAALPEPPPPVALPPVRKSWLLVLDGLGDAERGAELAAHIGVDVATARQLALSRHPRVALRSDSGGPLEQRAAALRTAGVAAAALSREDLEAAPAAVLLVALEDPAAGPTASRWLVDPWPHWTELQPPDPRTLRAQARPAPPLRVLVAVPGEVVVVRRAEARDLGRTTHRRHQPGHTVGEHRVSVLDLHGPGGTVRLVPGLSAREGWPGADQASATLAFRRLVDELDRVLPGVQVVGSRVCTPARSVHLSAEGPDRDRHVHTLSGWPTWEEHSRLCRLLLAPGA